MSWVEDEAGVEVTEEIIEQFLSVGIGSFEEWLRLPKLIRNKMYEIAIERQLKDECARIAAIAYAVGGDEARERALRLYSIVDGGKAERRSRLEKRASETTQKIRSGKMVL